ncbi:hypothetical protein DFH06DRAFT_1123882 [Mycena polygramma]|nr:hypothetical protein DFH06DRAFT_1123882 [Mycena polygramma]
MALGHKPSPSRAELVDRSTLPAPMVTSPQKTHPVKSASGTKTEAFDPSKCGHLTSLQLHAKVPPSPAVPPLSTSLERRQPVKHDAIGTSTTLAEIEGWTKRDGGWGMKRQGIWKLWTGRMGPVEHNHVVDLHTCQDELKGFVRLPDGSGVFERLSGVVERLASDVIVEDKCEWVWAEERGLEEPAIYQTVRWLRNVRRLRNYLCVGGDAGECRDKHGMHEMDDKYGSHILRGRLSNGWVRSIVVQSKGVVTPTIMEAVEYMFYTPDGKTVQVKIGPTPSELYHNLELSRHQRLTRAVLMALARAVNTDNIEAWWEPVIRLQNGEQRRGRRNVLDTWLAKDRH